MKVEGVVVMDLDVGRLVELLVEHLKAPKAPKATKSSKKASKSRPQAGDVFLLRSRFVD